MFSFLPSVLPCDVLSGFVCDVTLVVIQDDPCFKQTVT